MFINEELQEDLRSPGCSVTKRTISNEMLRNGLKSQRPKKTPRGVMVKAMNCGIVVREFVLQSRYYVHFRAITLGKGMNPLILPPAMGK